MICFINGGTKMKKMSQKLLADIVRNRREQKGMTQEQLGEQTGINRVMIGKIEKESYIPSLGQLEQLCEKLDFEVTDVLEERKPMYYSAFRGENSTDTDQRGIDYLLKMMMVSKQQLLLRKMIEKDV